MNEEKQYAFKISFETLAYKVLPAILLIAFGWRAGWASAIARRAE